MHGTLIQSQSREAEVSLSPRPMMPAVVLTNCLLYYIRISESS